MTVTDIEDPGKVIEPRGFDVHQMLDLASHMAGQRPDIRMRVAVDTRRHVDAKPLGQSHAGHHVGNLDLVTQAHRLDATIAAHGQAETRHRIGEIDEPGLRTEGSVKC